MTIPAEHIERVAIEAVRFTPGSDEAVALGCTCHRIDNRYGAGNVGAHGTYYCHDMWCPYHHPKERSNDH